MNKTGQVNCRRPAKKVDVQQAVQLTGNLQVIGSKAPFSFMAVSGSNLTKNGNQVTIRGYLGAPMNLTYRVTVKKQDKQHPYYMDQCTYNITVTKDKKGNYVTTTTIDPKGLYMTCSGTNLSGTGKNLTPTFKVTLKN